MLAQARMNRSTGYEHELVQILREHDLIFPEEEEQFTNYLFITQ